MTPEFELLEKVKKDHEFVFVRIKNRILKYKCVKCGITCSVQKNYVSKCKKDIFWYYIYPPNDENRWFSEDDIQTSTFLSCSECIIKNIIEWC